MLENLDINYCGDMTTRFMYFKTSDYSDFREKMLSANEIGGHLRLTVQNNAEEKLYLYDISSKKSLREYIQERSINIIFLKRLLEDLERAFLNGKSFMLDENNYCIHPDTVYFNDLGQAFLCYQPGYDCDIHEQLCSLFEFIIDRVDLNDRKSVYAAYRITSAVKEENCTFQTLLSLLKEGESEQLEEKGGISNNINENDFLYSKAIMKYRDRENKEEFKEDEKLSQYRQLLGKAAVGICFILVVIYFILN
jgi:hypothetical protein